MAFEDILIRLMVAAGAGMSIGLEREWREKAAGFRTLTLVAVASAIFMIGAFEIVAADGVRMMAGIATGIGFIGAGAIIRARGEVIGLTTAASVWMAAALGATAALGHYTLTVIGVVLTLIALLVLSLIPFRRVQRDIRIYRLTFAASIPVEHALSPVALASAGLATTLLTLAADKEVITVAWLAEGNRQAHERALRLLQDDDSIAAFSFGE